MEVNLHYDSVVNERTGEVKVPAEYVENLRALERAVQRYDSDIIDLKANLKVVRETREKAVAAMREAIREGKVLPLLEATPDDDE